MQPSLSWINDIISVCITMSTPGFAIGGEGIEPSTTALSARCSTTELPPIKETCKYLFIELRKHRNNHKCAFTPNRAPLRSHGALTLHGIPPCPLMVKSILFIATMVVFAMKRLYENCQINQPRKLPESFRWSISGSNRWPLGCKPSVLPAELMPHVQFFIRCRL